MLLTVTQQVGFDTVAYQTVLSRTTRNCMRAESDIYDCVVCFEVRRELPAPRRPADRAADGVQRGRAGGRRDAGRAVGELRAGQAPAWATASTCSPARGPPRKHRRRQTPTTRCRQRQRNSRTSVETSSCSLIQSTLYTFKLLLGLTFCTVSNLASRYRLSQRA